LPESSALMIKKYRVIFQGFRGDAESFVQGMIRLGVPEKTTRQLLEKSPAVIRRDATLRDARIYADAVQDAGGLVMIQENGHFEEVRRRNHNIPLASLGDFTLCPNCGFKQQRADRCIKCGHLLGNPCPRES